MSELKHEHNFTNSGRNWFKQQDKGNEHPKIPAGVFLIKFNPEIGFFLTEQEGLSMPSKTYGHNDLRAAKVLNTFANRVDVNTGVLLTGNKGSGKTLLAKDVCIKACQAGLPVLLLEAAYAGPSFNEFMNSFIQPVVIFCDEFEKKYDDTDKQNGLLSLLDGTGVNNKLWLLTSNSDKVSEFLLSRPSRLFYHWRYGKLEEEVLSGYCADHLKDQKHVGNMKTLLSVSTNMSFDVMQAVVEELNRYPEQHFADTLCDLNIDLGDALRRQYELKGIEINGEAIPCNAGNRYQFNLIEMQEGNTRVRTVINTPTYAFGADLKAALPPLDAYWYNAGLELEFKEGKITKEELEDRYDDELELNFAFKPATDVIDDDFIYLNRQFGKYNIRITLKTMKEDPVSVHFRRLFK